MFINIKMLLVIYFVGGVLTTIGIIYSMKLTGTVGDGLIPVFALAGGVIWPVLVIGGIVGGTFELIKI
jgi:hypothetical protein